VPATARLTGIVEARAFAESVGGVLDRHPPVDGAWPPGLTGLLDELGWGALGADASLAVFAGLGAVELGRRLAPVSEVDRLLGASLLVGELFRSPVGGVLIREQGAVFIREVLRSEPAPSAGGLDVYRCLELGSAVEVDAAAWPVAAAAWTAATIGYLAGLGQAALSMTTDYVRQRRAFGTTLAALGPVQQLLAGAATAVRGVQLLAAEPQGTDALAHAGPAITQACAACHQVTGAVGFTLEHPLPHHSQRALALSTWNDTLLDDLLAATRQP
jgi:hypothetical protein